MVISGLSQCIALPLLSAMSSGLGSKGPLDPDACATPQSQDLEALLRGTGPKAPYQIDEGDPPTVSIHMAAGGFPSITQGGLVGAMGLGLMMVFAPGEGLLAPPFELSVRLLRPVPPGMTVQAADFKAEGPNQRKGRLGGYGVSLALEGVTLARAVWQRLETVSEDFSGVLEGTDESDGSFRCLPSCFSAGEENPIGLKRTIFYRHGPAGVARLWADLDQGSGTDIRPQMVIGDELGWWMGAALMGKEGVTNAYTYRVRRFPDVGEPLRVVALRPSGKVRRIVPVPVRVVNAETGKGLAALEVKYMGRQDAASAGMGDQAGELVRFREERIGLLQGGKG